MIHIASSSAQRHVLAKQLGICFDIIQINIDETWQPTELAHDYVLRMAIEKAQQGQRQVQDSLAILAADTIVSLDDQMLGKATTKQEAQTMLTALSGQRHQVYSAIAVILNNKIYHRLNKNHVCFQPLSHQEIDRYIITGEYQGKAGGYAIQGQAAKFISHIEGSYSGVMGLPLHES